MIIKKVLLFLVVGQMTFAMNSTENVAVVNESQGMFTTKKVLIGSALVVGVGTTAVVAGPAIAVAGTAATIKTTAAAVATKAAVIAAGAKVAVAAKVTAAAVTAGLAKVAVPVAVISGYVRIAKVTYWFGRKTKECIYPTVEQKIERLEKDAKDNPLEKRLQAAFAKRKPFVEVA